jgi:hypothetical protein
MGRGMRKKEKEKKTQIKELAAYLAEIAGIPAKGVQLVKELGPNQTQQREVLRWSSSSQTGCLVCSPLHGHYISSSKSPLKSSS